MQNIKDSILKYQSDVQPFQAQLCAISKTKPSSYITAAYEVGQLDFGENKVQELAEKFDALPKDIRWHMVGHLQRNKVKYIAPFIYLIHSIDSIRLLKEINKEGLKNDRIINVLLQVHIAEEDTKFGFDEEELVSLIESDEFGQMTSVKVVGLMGMATNTTNEEQVRKEFQGLKILFEKLKFHQDKKNLELTTLSMGMSSDYKIALEEGSTMIRIGSSIFGERNYAK